MPKGNGARGRRFYRLFVVSQIRSDTTAAHCTSAPMHPPKCSDSLDQNPARRLIKPSS